MRAYTYPQLHEVAESREGGVVSGADSPGSHRASLSLCSRVRQLSLPGAQQERAEESPVVADRQRQRRRQTASRPASAATAATARAAVGCG